MRFIAAAATLLLAATPAFARDIFVLPEPDTMFLIGIAAAGLLITLGKKKK
jgi:hypothetical protein